MRYCTKSYLVPHHTFPFRNDAMYGWPQAGSVGSTYFVVFVRDQPDISLVYIVVAKVTIFDRFDLLDHNLLRDKFLQDCDCSFTIV